MTRRDAVAILASLVREHGDSRDEIALGGSRVSGGASDRGADAGQRRRGSRG